MLLRSSEIKPLFIDLTPHQRSRDARSSSPHPRAPRYPPPNIHTKPTPNHPRLPTLDFNRQSRATTQPRESTAPLKPAARLSFTTLTAPRAHLGQSQFHSTPHHTYTSPNTSHSCRTFTLLLSNDNPLHSTPLLQTKVSPHASLNSRFCISCTSQRNTCQNFSPL